MKILGHPDELGLWMKWLLIIFETVLSTDYSGLQLDLAVLLLGIVLILFD